MAKKINWMLPALAIGGIGAVALFVLPKILGEEEEDDYSHHNRQQQRRRRRRSHSGFENDDDGYGDLYRQRFMERPPVKRLPVVDVSDLIDRGGAERDENSYIITDKDFKLFDINRKDLPGYKNKYIHEPTFSKVIYGDKGDRPVIVPYYDGYSYATSISERQPELGRLTPGEQSLSNDRTNHLNLYAR